MDPDRKRVVDLQRDDLRTLLHWYFKEAPGKTFTRRQIATSLLMHQGIDPQDETERELRNFYTRLARTLRQMARLELIQSERRKIAAGFIELHYGLKKDGQTAITGQED